STESWSEGGTKPALGATIASAPVTSSGYVELDVTSAVQQKLNLGQSTVTFGFRTDIGTWSKYNSRENASNTPELVITMSESSSGAMQMGTNFWFLISWGEKPFLTSVNWATAYANGDNVW